MSIWARSSPRTSAWGRTSLQPPVCRPTSATCPVCERPSRLRKDFAIVSRQRKDFAVASHLGKDFAVYSRLRKNYAVASRLRNFIRRSVSHFCNSVVGLSTRLIRSCNLQMLDPCLCMFSPSVPINLVLIHAPASLICKGPGGFDPHFNPD